MALLVSIVVGRLPEPIHDSQHIHAVLDMIIPLRREALKEVRLYQLVAVLPKGHLNTGL